MLLKLVTDFTRFRSINTNPNPRLRTIVNVIEMMNKTSEIKVVIEKNDDVSFELEEVNIESSNSLLYLSGLDHHSKIIAGCVLVVQIAMFYLCYWEASANEVVSAAQNASLVIIRLFVAVSFSFSMTNSFTDCWLTMATKMNCAGHMCNCCNLFKLLFAMPSIIVGFAMNSIILAAGIFAAGAMGLRVISLFILRAAFKLISFCGLRDMKTGGDFFQPPKWGPHVINTYVYVPSAFILETAINAFACIAVLVVTKQLDSPINTVANFAGLMTILEFDHLIIDFMNLPKVLSLRVEKHTKPTQSEPLEKDIERSSIEEERPPTGTALPAKQDNNDSAILKEHQDEPVMDIRELKFSIFVYLVAISAVYLLI